MQIKQRDSAEPFERFGPLEPFGQFVLIAPLRANTHLLSHKK